MSEIWRITGPPENFITAISRSRWAVNEHNNNIWRTQLSDGDVVLFHSTRKSDYTTNIVSSIVGFATVGSTRLQKNEFWWIQEINDQQNHWPYVFDLRDIHLFSNKADIINFNTPIENKTNHQIAEEISALLAGCLRISALNNAAKAVDPNCPNFPVNGSISRTNELYHELILYDRADNLFSCSGAKSDSDAIQDALELVADESVQNKSIEVLLQEARNFIDSRESHRIIDTPTKVRIDDIRQKRRIAAIENYQCQVCGFRCPYTDSKGKRRWIIEVDHILEKHKGGNELIENLWALCPNCHEKKTRGVIKIDVAHKRVTENGRVLNIRDNHLFLN